ncbi:MAG TPA: hypothetical protein VIM89_23215 [Mucilaginibacter sp.]
MKKTIFLIVPLLLLSVYSHGQSVKRRVHPVVNGEMRYAYGWIRQFRFFGMKQKLYKDTISDEEYRFLCLPTLNYHEYIISIQKKANSYSVSWSKSNAVWYAEKRKADPLKSKEISESQWLEFTKKVHDMHFWQMDSCNGDEKTSTFYDDVWLFEGKDDRRYHIIAWYAPNSTKKLYSCLKYMLDLTGIKGRLQKPYRKFINSDLPLNR